MRKQIHLIIKSNDGEILKTDAEKITRDLKYELLMFENSISVPVISKKKARALLEKIRAEKYEKLYNYEISNQIFKGNENKQSIVLIEEGIL